MMTQSAASAPALWELYEDQFPVRDHLIYLNHAGVTPLCQASAEAMKRLADDAFHFGSFHYEGWVATYDGLRTAAARLIGGGPEDIAIVKNTSEGIAAIAMGFDWHPGDKIVAFEEEFPANYYPWKRLEATGVKVAGLSASLPWIKFNAASGGLRLS